MLYGLYGITDTTLTPYDKVLKMVEQALLGGMTILQLRDKEAKDEAIEPIAKELMALCQQHSALFFIDDRAELAAKLGAHLHIGKDDMTLQEARSILPNAIIGVSCYGDIERAKTMESKGADYVAFGSCFPSPTKPKSSIIPLDVIHQAKSILSIPICTIGGITHKNYAQLTERGADMVSVIHDLWSTESIKARAESYRF